MHRNKMILLFLDFQLALTFLFCIMDKLLLALVLLF